MAVLDGALGEQIMCSTAGHAVEIACHKHGDVGAGSDLLQALQQGVYLQHSTVQFRYYRGNCRALAEMLMNLMLLQGW